MRVTVAGREVLLTMSPASSETLYGGDIADSGDTYVSASQTTKAGAEQVATDCRRAYS